ncbi:MAG TPA: hypothetical protein VMW10_11415 [Alphaproteobacteria bacterium]|nr:hypothetical protein [Alphaproteobacteria bacterium]
MGEYTKGKWEVFDNYLHHKVLIRAKGKGFNVATCLGEYEGYSLEEKEANVRRIVQCVNSHDALLDACKKIKKIEDGCFKRGVGYDQQVDDIVEAAIAQAE